MRFRFLRRSSQTNQSSLYGPAGQDRLAQYNTYDARALFSHLLTRVRRGETIVIARSNEPVALLVPLPEELPARRPGVIRAHVLLGSAASDGRE
jgi:prevent-host-death family protein